MYCKTCGFLNKKDANFCCKCGESFQNEKDKKILGLRKTTWILMVVFLVISFLIGIISTIYSYNAAILSYNMEVSEVVELVATGENQSVKEARNMMGKLSSKQRKEVVDKINDILLTDCKSYISKGEFSEKFYEKIICVGNFLKSYGEIKKEVVNGFPTLEFYYQELMNNETEDIDIWETGKAYIAFIEDISGNTENDMSGKFEKAINVRLSYKEAIEYYQADNYQQALEICGRITPQEEDSKYIEKITNLKNDILEKYGEYIPKEVTVLLENENYEEALILLKGVWTYFKDSEEIKELFEQSVGKYIMSLINNSEYDKATTIANESLELMDSKKIKEYKDRLEQERWKWVYWNVLKENPVEKEFCLYEIAGKEIPVLILILNESYRFVNFNENTKEVESSTYNIRKYDKENDVFYEYKECDKRGEYNDEIFGYPDVHVEEWSAYTFNGAEMKYEYSLKKEVSTANGKIVDESYTFKGTDLKSEMAYDAQLLMIKGTEGLTTSSITNEEIEKILFD